MSESESRVVGAGVSDRHLSLHRLIHHQLRFVRSFPRPVDPHSPSSSSFIMSVIAEILPRTRDPDWRKHYVPILCPFDGCEYTPPTRQRKRQHEEAVHQGIRRFVCQWPGCGRTSSHKSELKHHFDSVHLKLAWIECHVCHKTFSHKSSVRCHMRSHQMRLLDDGSLHDIDDCTDCRSVLGWSKGRGHRAKDPAAAAASLLPHWKKKNQYQKRKVTAADAPTPSPRSRKWAVVPVLAKDQEKRQRKPLFACTRLGCYSMLPDPQSLKQHIDNHESRTRRDSSPRPETRKRTIEQEDGKKVLRSSPEHRESDDSGMCVSDTVSWIGESSDEDDDEAAAGIASSLILTD